MPLLVSNPAESYQANIIACAAITWAIGAIFVALRFYTRGRILHNVLGAEDWFILVALVFSGATSAGMIEPVYGLGKHMLDINPAVMMPMARAGWYTILYYMMALLFTKVSILLLYIRILSYQHARYAVYAITAVIVLTNGLWTMVTVVTACMPLRAFWDPTVPGAYCRPAAFWFANTGMHIGTDVLLYILPLPIIVNLHVRTRQKIALVCIISVVRLWELVEEYKRVDFTFDNVSISYLTCIEVNAAIACACCMTLKPFVARVFPRLFGGSRSDSAVAAAAGRRDAEAAAGSGRERGERGPPTIGSKPSRITTIPPQLQKQQKGQQRQYYPWPAVAAIHGRNDSHSQLLDDDDGDDDDSTLTGGSHNARSDEKHSHGALDVDSPMMSPLSPPMQMPRELPAAYSSEKGDKSLGQPPS
ncbi:hypothetical protein B0T26DRAFT_766369 [Lasiosphaeria miniovina]|uniref:Rhodopsin domain-containing protein n=1 Tax=Lasiosphaeria miniovina TaxID=1954250 RepID=A0AA40B4W0_9PEZI|nr:uncharacterized protein B0T26DRAFT_766369 [Lasiosphaeria miniovina]KAK0727766.1 hypothetical protein B0T26DRAFT_766369 [Lasiosphaeria miniovina]